MSDVDVAAVRARLKAIDPQRTHSTHWEGCYTDHHRSHDLCAITALLAALDQQQALVTALTARLTSADRRLDQQQREIEELAGDATTLRGYIKTYRETPAMTASNRNHWQRRAEKAEADLAAAKAAQAQDRAALVAELIDAAGHAANMLKLVTWEDFSTQDDAADCRQRIEATCAAIDENVQKALNSIPPKEPR